MSSRSEVFKSLAVAGKRELVIKKESESAEAAFIQSGDYDGLFSISTLNHLQVSGFPEVKSLSSKISQLNGLLQLILDHNELSTLPDEVGSLSKLKFLDLSHNKIKELPPSFYNLASLHTLILGHNSLTDASFPDLSGEKDVFPNLHHLDMVENQLSALPPFVYRAHTLQELVVTDNVVASLEPMISSLVSLKQLDMRRNKLTTVPFELTACSKLKSLRLEENPVLDRRLTKLILQHGAGKPKAVLDYIASHCPKATSARGAEERAGAGGGGGKKGKKKKKDVKSEDDRVHSKLEDREEDSDLEIEFSDSKPQLQVIRPSNFVEVVVTPEARKVRPYIVCAVVRRVDLSRENNFAKFIALQTKLHDTVCKRRRAATIATHDLLKLTPPLNFVCQSAEAFALTPLGWSEAVSCRKFLQHLEANKPDKTRGGGAKKGGAKQVDPAAAALSKYLQLVNPAEMVALQDSAGSVVSLPPLTNCESTKVETHSTDLFLEVTSSDTLATCKAVMDALIYAMCEAGVATRDNVVLSVEQVRVVEATDSKLLVLYPSRTDLSEGKYDVVRP